MQKQPLFRKVNTTAHRPHVVDGGRYRAQRNTKTEIESDAARRPMHGKTLRGKDYTPLFRFLLSKVGQPWNQVHSEAVRRLDREEPIFWLVALRESERRDYVLMDDTSYYSGLYVDSQGLLQRVNPSLGPSSFEPMCKCCTYTFNGVRFTRPFRGLRSSIESGDDNVI